MSSPLFLTSSKPARTAPLAGQIQLMSSSTAIGLAAATVGADATVAATGADAADAAAAEGVATTCGLAIGFTTTSPPAGGITRKTWPTSIRLGLSTRFQRTIS